MSDTQAAIAILRRAASLFTGPETFVQGTYARNSMGTPVFEEDPDATCFCALGAINRARNGLSVVMYPLLAREALKSVIGGAYISDWNDMFGRTWIEVRDALNKAADNLETAARHE